MAGKGKSKDAIRVGVVGVGRGMSYARGGETAELKLVAICDTWEEKLKEANEQLGVATYTDYEKFLEHDMDAVVLANFFHEHAPFAVKALQAGFHVMSECAACSTLAEGVALVRAVEKSGRMYLLAENYPYFAYNQEMRRLYREGVVGKFLYGECEYVHPDPAEVKLARSVGWNHWRNWIPSTYYCTHSVGPIMYITDTRPVRVNGFVIPHDFDDPTITMAAKHGDTAAAIMMRMDNGAIAKSLHGGLRGHQTYTRIHGNKGLMENCRVMNTEMLRLHRAPYVDDDPEIIEKIYVPDFPEHHGEAMQAGHGGGDFFTKYNFAQAIRSGQQPYMDIYRGVDMSIVGILAYRSALKDGAPVDVPDFRKEEDRKAFEDDDWSPWLKDAREGQPLPSILGRIEPTEEAKANARRVWAKHGVRSGIAIQRHL